MTGKTTTMKLKMEDGHAVLLDGKPVYVADDGRETAIDVAGTVATITRLNAEAKGHREAKEAAEASLKAFAGITDPAAAIKALQVVSGLDAKKLIDAGEVETVKAEITKGFTEKLTAAEKRAAEAEGRYTDKVIGEMFLASKFITEKTLLPPTIARSAFGSHIKIEDGKPVAYGFDGNKIYSPSRPGELASPEEAIEALITAHPDRDNMLKGNSNGGAGVRQGSGGGGARTMTRAQLEALAPEAQMKAMTVDKVSIVD